MKTSCTLNCCVLFAALLCLGYPAADASNIAYTYDGAGRLIITDYGTNRVASYAYDNAGNLLETAQPSLGLIVMSRQGNQLTLAWPATPAGYRLQSAATVAPGTLWTDVAGTVSQSGNLKLLTVSISGTTYFRLKNQSERHIRSLQGPKAELKAEQIMA